MHLTSLFTSERQAFRKKLLLASSAGCLAAFALQVPAMAQTASVTEEAEVEAITVTASRINRAGYEAPTPTTIVGTAAIESQAPLNIVEVLNTFPSMTPTNFTGSSTAIGANRPNFRGLGPVRTLVLLDGNRVAYTDPLGGVDLNIIPTSLVRGIEVVSGGASADWGSDAVAGIINFNINSTFEGIKGNFQCGQSQYDDNQGCGGSIGVGKGFFDDRLNVVAAVDWADNNGVLDTTRRPWSKKNYARIINPAYAAGNGQFQQLTTDNACYQTMTSAGLITSGPLRWTTFTPQGDPIPFSVGQYAGLANNFWMVGGTCEQSYSMRVGGQVPGLERLNGYTKITFNLTPGTRIYAEALYAETESYTQAIPNYNTADIRITLDNAFLPPQLRAAMIQNNITNFMFGRWQPESGVDDFQMISLTSDNRVNRYVVGAEGELGGSWNWDAHVQSSRARYHSLGSGNRNNAKWNLAIDAVINPATGLPACRVNADTNPNNNDPACVPADLFGAGSISPGVIGYVGGAAEAWGFYRSKSVAANIQGDIFSLPAGVVSFAAGAEARKDELEIDVDEVSLAGLWRYQGLQEEAGAYNVKEAYAEAVVPIFKDAPMASNLELNIAGRITDYSTSGVVKTWKIGFNYAPFDASVLRFRGTLSQDIRAPTLHELYAKAVNAGNGISDPACGGCFRPVPNFLGGNINLVPEVARTKVIGLVFRPTFFDGFTTSVDFYDIKIRNGIIAISGTAVVENCFIGLQEFCSAVNRDAAGNITSVLALPFNAQGLQRQGVDIEATYTRNLADWFEAIPGTVTFNALVNYNRRNTTITRGVVVNNAGVVSGAGGPNWRGNLNTRYALDRWEFNFMVNYIGKGIIDRTNTLANPFYLDVNDIRAYVYLDANLQYEVKEGLEVFAGVDNILNQGPPVASASTTQTSSRNSSPWYDNIGRAYKAGVRFQF